MTHVKCRLAPWVFALASPMWIAPCAAMQVIPSPDTTRDFGFGNAVAMNSEMLVAGAAEAVGSHGSSQGRVYVFERGPDGWQLVATLEAPDGEFGDRFGCSLALDGMHLLVGACGDTEPGEQAAGSAYLFEKAENGWGMVQKLRPAKSIESWGFGFTLAIEADRILVGAPWTNVAGNAAQGAVFAFERQVGTWTATQIITDPQGEAVDNFGGELAMRGDTAVIAAMRARTSERSSGAVLAFQSGPSGWAPRQRLSQPEGDFFGWSLSLGESVLAVTGAFGASRGRVYLFSEVDGEFALSAQVNPAEGSEAGPTLGGLATNGVDFFVSEGLAATLRIREDGEMWSVGEIAPYAGVLSSFGDELAVGRASMDTTAPPTDLGEVRISELPLHRDGFEQSTWTVEAAVSSIRAGSHPAR